MRSIFDSVFLFEYLGIQKTLIAQEYLIMQGIRKKLKGGCLTHLLIDDKCFKNEYFHIAINN